MKDSVRKKIKIIFLVLSIIIISLFFGVLLFFICKSIITDHNNEYDSNVLLLLMFLTFYLSLIIPLIIDLKNTIHPKENTKKRKDTRNSKVEGIIKGRQFDLLDSNSDGIISVDEFYPLTEEEVFEKIKESNYNFSKEEFYSFCKELFIKLQSAWTDKDLVKIKVLEDDSLFSQHRLIIDDLNSNNLTDVRKDVFIKGVLLKDYKIEGNNEIVVVALTADVKKYIVDSKGEIISGDNEHRITIPYILTLEKNKDVNNSTSDVKSNCPNCGSVVDVDSDGICKYCGSLLDNSQNGWRLLDIKNIDINKI